MFKKVQVLDESYNTDKQSDSHRIGKRRRAIYSLMEARDDDILPQTANVVNDDAALDKTGTEESFRKANLSSQSVSRIDIKD